MISSYLQLVSRRYRRQLDKDADEFIQYAVDGATRMKALINALLSLSRVGKYEEALEATDCNEVLQNVLEVLQLNIDESGRKCRARRCRL